MSESSPSSFVMTTLGGIAATYIFLWALLHLTHNSQEPGLLLTSIPFISPILGMIRWSKDFYAHMRERHPHLPIYTLRLPGARLYAINSLDLIPVVQRQWRTLLFAPIQVKAAKAGMGASKEAIAVLERDMVTEQGFVNGMVKVTHPTMSSGSLGLDGLNRRASEVFAAALGEKEECCDDDDDGDAAGKGVFVVSLYAWIGKLIMQATTEAVYGPDNPMRDEKNLEAWGQYHPALMYIMLDILPQNIFFKQAVQGRETLVKAFAQYFANGSYQRGSAYIQQFVAHCIAQEVPVDDIPRFLLGTVFNNVANSIPTAFWFLYRILSDPEVLADCREEVLQAVRHNDDNDATSVIDLGFVLGSCPVLMSTWQEVFRFHGMANSVRVVSENHMLADQYLLKKGGLVMMSARAQHINPEVWGADVLDFNHRRFLKGDKKRSIDPAAFRAFGGGTTLCPGRHFAMSEIMLLAAMVLVRFDVRPKNGGPWVLPSTAKSSQAEAMEQPDEDVEVELVPRAEAVGRIWRIKGSGA